MADALAACVAGAEVVLDPDPDHGLRSPWRTYRHALERTPPEASHRLVIQDDVLVCDRFLDGVDLAVAARPDRVLCLFVAGNPANHKRAVLAACDRDETWAELDLTTWIPVVATLWPVRLVEPLLSWYDARRDDGRFPAAFTADDEIVGRFLRDHRERPLACVPSLVEHPDTVPSVANGHRRGGTGLDPGRQAACFIGDCGYCDATLIDWTTGAGG
jgi:hypothetical protein